MPDPTLDLEELARGSMPGLTARLGAAMAEAASVCLDDCGHTSPTYLAVDGDQDRSYAMIWQLVTEQARRSWADEQFATEQGAYGVAILLVRDMRGHSVVERSRKGNGFDYWMGPADGTLFSAKSRLEVSGIRRGDPGQIGRRVREKTQQIAVSSGRLPGIVVVVEFGKPIARLVDR